MLTPVLETERLRLRPPTLADLAVHHARLGSDPAVAWLGEPTTHAESEKKVRHRVDHFARHDFGLWIVEAKDTDEFLGECGLQYFDGTEGRRGRLLPRPRRAERLRRACRARRAA